MGTTGISLSFFPKEISQYIITDSTTIHPLILQVLGALYFAFAMLYWTAKENLIGGIYGRPIAIGNLAHFVIGALSLIKGVSTVQNGSVVWIAAMIYTLFAVLFALVFFKHPSVKEI